MARRAIQDQDYGTQVALYWNLHRKCWSVRSMVTGLVIGHMDSATLIDVTFKVSEAGRQRVLREHVKNVHAYAVGTLVRSGFSSESYIPVTYNPYKYRSFVMAHNTDVPVHHARRVVTDGRQVLATGLLG